MFGRESLRYSKIVAADLTARAFSGLCLHVNCPGKKEGHHSETWRRPWVWSVPLMGAGHVVPEAREGMSGSCLGELPSVQLPGWIMQGLAAPWVRKFDT